MRIWSGCAVMVSSADRLGPEVPCPGVVEWAADLPQDARPERRCRVYLCAEHVGEHAADPRRLTVEDVDWLAARRREEREAARQIAEARARWRHQF